MIYVPPETSQQVRNNTIEQRPYVLAREVSAAVALGDVLLGSDFNAKAATAQFNRHGRQLLQLCQDTKLVFSTGKVPGDTAVAPTWVSQRGRNSRLEYVLVSQQLFSAIVHRNIPEGPHRRSDSDHQPICINLDIVDTA